MYKNGANLRFNCFLSIYFHRREASRSIHSNYFWNAKTSLYLVIILARFCLLVDNTKYQLYAKTFSIPLRHQYMHFSTCGRFLFFLLPLLSYKIIIQIDGVLRTHV